MRGHERNHEQSWLPGSVDSETKLQFWHARQRATQSSIVVAGQLPRSAVAQSDGPTSVTPQ